MKKFLSILLAIAFVLSMTTAAFAAGAGDNTTTVEYSVNPSYSVTIPENVTLGETANISITDASVAKGSKVVVKITATSPTANAFTVKTTEGAELTYTITDGTTTYGINDIVLEAAPTDTAKGGANKDFTFTTPTDVIYAGTYTGTVIFNVSVVAA